MPLINKGFFIGDISISQISQPQVEEVLIAFIAKYETPFLTALLGYGFQKLMLANSSEQRFKDIIEGVEYTDSKGVLKMWYGLANPTTKFSAIAQYVFYQYVRSKHEIQTGIATVKPKAENAIVIVPQYTLNKSWNDMCDMIDELRMFLHSKASDYPEYVSRETKCFRRSNTFM